MYPFIEFIIGPMFWISLVISGIGILVRITCLAMLAAKKEPFVFKHLSLKYSCRSILAWTIPFVPKTFRNQPAFYIISYLFHVLLFVVPLFLLSHVIVLETSFNFAWWTVSDQTADILTIVITFSLVYFFIRRLVKAEVKFLTTWSDYGFLCMVAIPFITGFFAYHQLFAYRWMIIIHVVSAELIIILIPFTRLFHMFLAPFSRAYTGSEFGGVRHARDW